MPSLIPAARRLYKQYGPIIKLIVFGAPLFIITDVDLVHQVTTLKDKRVPEQGKLGGLKGKSIFTKRSALPTK